MNQVNARALFLCIKFACGLLMVMGGILVAGEGANIAAVDDHNHDKVEVKVGVVLNMELWLGKMGLSCINMAISDFYESRPQYKTRLVLHTRNSMGDVVTAADHVLYLIENVKVQSIIGPTTSPEAQFIINLGDKAQVPIVTYSATSPLLASNASPYFIQATQDDSSQVQAITALIHAFGWRQVVPIYEDNQFGSGLIPYLEDALQQIGDQVPYRSVIPTLATDENITGELKNLKTIQTRVFVVHLMPALGSRLFLQAKELGMMSPGYVWIITNAMANVLNILEPNVVSSMQGTLGVKTYVPSTTKINDFTRRWQSRQFLHDNPRVVNLQLNVYGLWAYDAVSALARAVERVALRNVTFNEENDNYYSSTDLSKIGRSDAGPGLLEAIRGTRFRGLSGNFSLVNRQLDQSVFQFINIVGNGTEKEIGYWTKDEGIVKHLKSGTTTGPYSTSKNNLRKILWPGDSTHVPKGWEIPTEGKTLLIGVPKKDGFTKFVNVTRNASTNSTLVTGYCIDVFEAVISILPYSLPFKYVPFEKPDGESAGSYNDLIYQIYLKNYDAVVGDTTIRANRSKFVDFTLPYTESGVTMVVPLKSKHKKDAFIFMRPLSQDLWITILSFFVLMAVVIWVLEHRINPGFQGPARHQVGTSLYYSFSAMVFAHGQLIFNNLTRIVVIIWVFLLLILTQSYTASLASLLTIEQLQPTVTNVQELIKNNEYVGYQKGSFVLGLLKQMNIDEARLRTYNSLEELDELLTNGSAGGGVAAAFDEIPFVKLLISDYCPKYVTVPPTYKTDGFGFAFPIGSPLVSDISRAILNVTEGDKMTEIENKWFKQQDNCAESSASVSSTTLSLNDFWLLFMITGTAAGLAVAASVARFLYEHRREWLHSDPDSTIWSRTRKLLKNFHKPKANSYTMRSQTRDASIALITPRSSEPQTPPTYVHSPSLRLVQGPSSLSIHGEPSSTPSSHHLDSTSAECGNQEIVLEMPLLSQGRTTTPPEIMA